MANITTNGKNQDVSIDDLSAQIETLRRDLSSLTSTIAGLGRTKAVELSDAASTKSAELSEAARRKGAETAEFVSTRARDAQEQASQFVTAQPATALGLAAGAGFLFGYLTSRR